MWAATPTTDAMRLGQQAPSASSRSYGRPSALLGGVEASADAVCVVVGPSGAGKSTLIKRLMAELPGKFGFSTSHTTRDPRPGERPGVDYHFTTYTEMGKRIAAGEFVEHAEVHGNFYGTSIAEVQKLTRQSKVCLLDIDVQGAETVRRSTLNAGASYVFLAPPSLPVLEQRLRGRGTETEERIQKRLAGARREMAVMEQQRGAWDVIVVNDDLDRAYGEFSRFLQRTLRQASPRDALFSSSQPASPSKLVEECKQGRKMHSVDVLLSRLSEDRKRHFIHVGKVQMGLHQVLTAAEENSSAFGAGFAFAQTPATQLTAEGGVRTVTHGDDSPGTSDDECDQLLAATEVLDQLLLTAESF